MSLSQIKVNNSVVDVNMDYSIFNYKDCVNLVNPNFIARGYYLNVRNNGQLVPISIQWPGSDGGVSDYIPVFFNNEGHDVCSINAYDGGATTIIATYCVYDRSLNPLRSGITDQYTYQDGDYFVRFSFFGNDILTPMANYGTEKLAYSQYTETKRTDLIESGFTQLSNQTDVLTNKVTRDEKDIFKLKDLCNLIDPDTILLGYLRTSDGRYVNETISGNWGRVSEHILVFFNGEGHNISANSYRGGAGSVVASYVVYNENKEIIRIHGAQNDDTDEHYTYQSGDYYIRLCFFVDNGFMANYGSTYLNYIPYTVSYRLDRLIEKVDRLNLPDIDNGSKVVIATGAESDWIDGNNSEFYPDGSFDFFEKAGTYQTWVSSRVLMPNMGKYLYIKARVTNIGDGITNYGFLANPDLGSEAYAWQSIGNGTLSVGQSTDVYIEVDLANLVMYHGFTNTIAIWVQCSLKADYDTKIRVENLEMYQFNDREGFAHFDGSDLSELLHSIDDAFDNVHPSQGSSQFIIGPTGEKYLLSANASGNLVLIPFFPSKAYYYGNSLLISRGFGLAASDNQHDFYYLVNQFFTSKKSGFIADRSGAIIESSTSVADGKTRADTMIDLCPSDAELIVVQCGDNVSSANYETIFHPVMEYLIEGLRTKAQGARILLVASWYGNVSSIMQDVANKYGATFVNIISCRGSDSNSHIGAVIKNNSTSNRGLANVSSVTEVTNDDQNYNYKINVVFSVNEQSYNTSIHCYSYSLSGTTLTYNSEEEVMDTAGEASHPGDLGFKKIANKILYDGGYVDTEEYYK